MMMKSCIDRHALKFHPATHMPGDMTLLLPGLRDVLPSLVEVLD